MMFKHLKCIKNSKFFCNVRFKTRSRFLSTGNLSQLPLLQVALVGRPNVGKSSMFNRLYGEARAIVSEVAGTTRDTLDAELEKDGRIYKFIDTAGIRRKGKVQYGSEFFMVNRALKVSLEFDA